MALVAYDNSDSSDYEDDDKETLGITPNKKEESSNDTEELTSDSTVTGSEKSLFILLPQPTRDKQAVVEEDDEFLHKKEQIPNVVKPKAKISVPSLKDFKDIESSNPNAKPKRFNNKKSGLLSLLPQPKNGVTVTKSLIPHILTQKPNNPNLKKKDPLPSAKKSKADEKSSINDYSDDSDNDDVQNDFFSINKPTELIEDAPIELEEEVSKDSSVSKKPFNIESYFKADIVENDTESAAMENEETSSSYENESEQPNNDVVLDEEAIMKLCGTRGKRKRENIQIVDVNQKEVLADAKEWLLKGLMDDTTKRVSASKRKGHEPTSQQKRKHQITYLAYQAKANEAELQNQWANSRMSRRQTQSKYGF